MIVRARVALKRTIVGDLRFDNLNGGHPQNQVNNVCQSMMFDSEDDFSSGCRNGSHQQQFVSELTSPG